MKDQSADTFETSLKRLEEIARLLDREDLGLDNAIQLYEEGIELSKVCFTRLKEAELKITTLKKSLENSENGFEE